jgi:hypothetical protein
MALHESLPPLLKDALCEFLIATEFCLKYRKPDGGSLGFPAAALMFSIADSLGSYHRQRPEFTVNVDGKKTAISGNNFQHYYIFNSSYYGLNLSKSTIRSLYEKYRCLLLHNTAMPLDGCLLFENVHSDHPFLIEGPLLHVNVSAFFRVTQNAVRTFISQIDEVVPGSDQEQNINRKR